MKKIYTLLTVTTLLAVSARSNTWTQKRDMYNNAKARRGAESFVVNGKGYVIGGASANSSSQGDINDVWEYDPTLNTWTQKANFGGGYRSFLLAFSVGNKGYAGGGWGSSSTYAFMSMIRQQISGLQKQIFQ